MSEQTFSVDAFITSAVETGQAVENRSGSGRGAVIPLPASMVEDWRKVLAASLDRKLKFPIPPQLLPPAIAAIESESNRATELGRTLRAAFASAEGGDGSVVWISVEAPNTKKGTPMLVRSADRISPKATVYTELLEAGRIGKDGRYLTQAPSEPASA